MQRPLGTFEQFLLASDKFAPLVMVGVLQLRQAPTPDIVQRAFLHLQQTHLLLRVSIQRSEGTPHFVEISDPLPVPVEVLPRVDETQWQQIAETQLNHAMDSQAPLLRCTYLYQAEGLSELIISLHHTIIDGGAGIYLFDELLETCTKQLSGESIQATNGHGFAPAAETLFPAMYQGASRWGQTASFAWQQLKGEMGYRRYSRNRQKPVDQSETRCRILTGRLSQPVTKALIRRSRRERLPLNSLLKAAMMQAVAKHCHPDQNLPLRGMVFADLRPYLTPTVPKDQLGVYLSMLQVTASVDPMTSAWALAETIQQQIYQATKRGDKFTAVRLSNQMIKAAIRLHAFRLGNTALSYLGPVQLQSAYGPIQLEKFHGFISNNVIGPEYAAVVHLLFGQLQWNIMYLNTDMDQAQAQIIMDEIETILVEASA
ncbi:MAG: condensation domain-containing protein [Chloroflexota bacterium]